MSFSVRKKMNQNHQQNHVLKAISKFMKAAHKIISNNTFLNINYYPRDYRIQNSTITHKLCFCKEQFRSKTKKLKKSPQCYKGLKANSKK